MTLDQLIALGREPVEVSFEMPNGQTGTVRMRSPDYGERAKLLADSDEDNKDQPLSEIMVFHNRLVAMCLVEETSEDQAGQLIMLSGGVDGPIFQRALELMGSQRNEDGKDSGSENPSPSG